MRILVLTTDFLPNISGIATLTSEQARGLASHGHEVQVVTTTPGAAEIDRDGPVEVREYESSYPPVIRLFRLFRVVSDAIQHWQPDFLWCANYRGFGLPAMRAAKKLGLPYGLYIHGTELLTENKNRFRRSILHKVAHNAAVVCTNSNHTTTLLESLYHIHGTPVTPGVHSPPGDTRDLLDRAAEIRGQWMKQKPVSCADSDRIIFISSCRIAKEKGIGTVLQAIALLERPLRERVLFIIGGSGPAVAEFNQMTDELGVREQVIFSGFTERKALQATLKAADVYMQPSQPHGDYLEGFGISFLEAQAVGLPCIATDWCGIPEAIKRDITGILVPPSSPAAIAEAMKFVTENHVWRQDASRESIAWAAANSWEVHASRLEPLLLAASQPDARAEPQ